MDTEMMSAYGNILNIVKKRRDAKKNFASLIKNALPVAELCQEYENVRSVSRTIWKLFSKWLFWSEAKQSCVNPIALPKRLAIALYALGSSAEYRTVGNVFGVGRTTVGEIVTEFCQAVCDNMYNCIGGYPPTTEKIIETVDAFNSLGFPQCYGAMDGTHIAVNVPTSEAADYHNYKGWNCIVLFASADDKSRFMYINVGHTGRNNDSHIFESSVLRKAHEFDPLFRMHSKLISGLNIPVVLIGDSAFKLSDIVLKPFAFSAALTERERRFNYRSSKCRRVIECAFGQLKGRFRRIGKGVEVKVNNALRIIKACCILHNFLLENNDVVPHAWVEESDRSSQHIQPATTSRQQTITGIILRNR